MKARPLVAVAIAAVALVCAGTFLAAPNKLPDNWRVWLDEQVYPLITGEERRAFMKLETEDQRQEMAERLWTGWSAKHELGRAFRKMYEERLETCRTEFGSTIDDRARIYLIHGAPDVRMPVNCDRVFNPLEIWTWGYLTGLGENITVIFYKPYGLGRFRMWDPNIESRSVLYTTEGNMSVTSWAQGPDRGYQIMRPEYTCGANGQDVLRMIGVAELFMKDLTVRKAMEHMQWAPGGGTGKESASQRFIEFSTVIAKDAKPVDFEFKAETGQRRGSKMAVSFSGALHREGLTVGKVGDTEVVQVDVVGEISRDGQRDDRFRYSFTFPAASTELPIVIERELRPGTYHLRLKVADANSNHAGVRDLDFMVAEPVVAALTDADKAVDATVAQAAKAQLPVLSLQGPQGDGISGVQRFTALAGPQVARIEFLLSGKTILTKNRPPFEVELDLGPVPRLASIVAVAYSVDGNEIERRQIDVNVGRERFFVRLQPVSGADRKGGKVRAQVAVNVPSETKLSKLELFWNEELVATQYNPPFDAWLPVKDDGSIGYMRALATLEDGAQAEDIRFVNAPQFLTGVEVQTVELAITALGSNGKPVEGLKETDFEIVEDGKPQVISHFARQAELPVRLGIVIDTSGSMEKTLPEVQRVVLGFLRNLLRPVDRTFVVSFSDRPALLEGFTADFPALERALIALRSDRGTALNDATVFGLFQFSGVRGRKAMVILTDGEDNASRISHERTLDYAQRSGVTIYTIGVDLAITKIMIRSQLSKVAKVTGGEAFFLARGATLQPVYDTINRELRSQYLLTYTSSSERTDNGFRKITVKVKRPGIEVRHMAGYYPGG